MKTDVPRDRARSILQQRCDYLLTSLAERASFNELGPQGTADVDFPSFTLVPDVDLTAFKAQHNSTIQYSIECKVYRHTVLLALIATQIPPSSHHHMFGSHGTCVSITERAGL